VRARVCSSALVASAVGVRARTDARRSEGIQALGALAPRATQGLPERANLLGGASAVASALLCTHWTHTSLDSHAPDPRVSKASFDNGAEAPPAAAGRRCPPCRGRGAARPPRPRRAAPRRAGPRRAPQPPPARPARVRTRALSSAAARLARPGPTGAPVRSSVVVRDAWAAPALQLCWLQAGIPGGCVYPGPGGNRIVLRKGVCVYMCVHRMHPGCAPPHYIYQNKRCPVIRAQYESPLTCSWRARPSSAARRSATCASSARMAAAWRAASARAAAAAPAAATDAAACRRRGALTGLPPCAR